MTVPTDQGNKDATIQILVHALLNRDGVFPQRRVRVVQACTAEEVVTVLPTRTNLTTSGQQSTVLVVQAYMEEQVVVVPSTITTVLAQVDQEDRLQVGGGTCSSIESELIIPKSDQFIQFSTQTVFYCQKIISFYTFTQISVT